MYNIKHYSKSKVFIQTIQTKKLVNISNFSSQANGWVWDLYITLDLKITNEDFNISDLIEVYYKWDFIYSWYLLDVNKLYWPKTETVTLDIVWYASLLSQYVLNQTYTDLASNIVKDIIDKANIEYWFNIFNYDITSIPDTVWNINIGFEYETYFKALEEISEITWIDFFVDIDWKVYFTSTRENHILTLRKDVEELDITEEWRSIVNSIIVDYDWWVKTYTNPASITKFWLKQKYESKQDIKNETTADKYWESFLADNSNKINKTWIIVNNNYTYFNIKAWDTIRIRNSPFIIEDIEVKRIIYDYETARIELWKTYSFAKEIFSNN